MKYTRSSEGVLWSPWKPVAVCCSRKSCCKLRTNVSCWRWEWGLLSVCPGPCGPVGSLSPDPAVLLNSPALWWLTGPVSGCFRAVKGERWHTGGPWLVSEVQCYMSLFPFPLEVLKGLKGEEVVASCFGRTLLPEWKLHFSSLTPLLHVVVSGSFAIWPLEERLARPDQALSTQLRRGLWLCGSESGKPCRPGVWAQLVLAGLPPNLDTLRPLKADRPWRVPELHSEVPVQVAVLWATPLLAPVCQETIVMGVLLSNPRKMLSPA